MNTHKPAIAGSCSASGLLSRSPQDPPEGAGGGSKGVQALHPPALQPGCCREGAAPVPRGFPCPAQMVTSEFNILWFITTWNAERPCFLETSANPPLRK